MAASTTGQTAKQPWTMQESKTRPLSRNRLKSYFTSLHHSGGYNDFEDAADSKPASQLLDETAQFEPDILGLCGVMKSRLLKYPDKPLTVQHYGPLLRILEHCHNLTNILAEANEKRALNRQETTSLPAKAQQAEEETDTHCPTCSCSSHCTSFKVPAHSVQSPRSKVQYPVITTLHGGLTIHC